MNYQCDEARLSAKEVQEIYRNMEAKGLTHIYCQACSEEMTPDATREEIDQALEEDFPGYLASFNQP